jgi:hypothetical protein
MKRLPLTILSVFLISSVFFTGCAPAEFEVVSLQVPEQVVATETFDIRAEVINKGGREGVYTAVLKVNGVEAVTKDITIPAGSTGEALFPVTLEEPSTGTLEIGGMSAVVDALKPAELLVTSLEPRKTAVLPGEDVLFSATGRNVGEVERFLTAVLYVDGEEKDRQSLSMEPQVLMKFSFPVTFDLPGNYEIDVSGNMLSPASVKVWDIDTYHNELYGFTIMHPGGWQVRESPDKVIIKSEGLATMTIDIDSVAANANPDELYWSNVAEFTQQSPEDRLAWKELMGVSKSGSVIFRHRTGYIYENSSGDEVHKSLAFFKLGTNYYVIMLEALYSDVKGHLGFYTDCLLSFEHPDLIPAKDR